MTIYNLHLPAETATRCKLLLDRVQPHAVDEQLECSFLLSVASMLLCQTNDKIRKSEYTDHSIAQSKSAFMKALTTKLSALANDAVLPLNVRAATAHWGCIRRYKPSIAEFARGPEEILDRQPSAPCAGADWQTGSLFKHLRNGIAHGCVWWGPEPKRSRCGVRGPRVQMPRLGILRGRQKHDHLAGYAIHCRNLRGLPPLLVRSAAHASDSCNGSF